MKLGAAAMLTLAAGKNFAAMPERKLSFYNIHTGESLSATYWAEGAYVGESLAEINHVLRDFRTNQAIAMDRGLLDLLYAINLKLDGKFPIHVISGYRSPATNAFLHAHSNGVAKHSLHMKGEAADIFLPGRDLSTLHRAALSMNRGGVGYYPHSNFVHVDVGRVRSWQG